jgi:hypothetical protein
MSNNLSVKRVFCVALLCVAGITACQKKNDAPTPDVAGGTAASGPSSGNTTSAGPSAADSQSGGSPGPAGVTNTPGASGSGATAGVTGSGTQNAPRMDPVPGQSAEAPALAASGPAGNLPAPATSDPK